MITNFNDFFKSAFTVDNVIFGFDEGDLKVLLIKRGEEPYMGKWALPGYFVYPNEDIRPESGWSSEIGVKQGFQIGNWKGYVDLSAYWMEFVKTR